MRRRSTWVRIPPPPSQALSTVGLIVGRLPTALLALACGAGLLLPAAAGGGSAKLGKHHCQITGGGRFVDLPEFPGERVDRRLLKDLAFLREKFKILVIDGYSNSKAHVRNGEHPIGLAVDVVPDESIGGDWGRIGDLARWAEPRQNRPVGPFYWVGYWGDKRHGPGDHLHLSWDHSPTRPKHVARTVETLFCP